LTVETNAQPEGRNQAGNATTGSPLLSLSAIELKIGNKAILNDISLDLFSGEFISLMGPNGSGKTSLLLTIMGLVEPTSGTKSGFGRDLANQKTSELVQDLGFIFQNPDHQIFTASIREEALFTLQNLGLLSPGKEAEAMAWLTRLGLANELDRHPQSLSYGEKRRLNLIGAILHGPQLLLIDEMLIGQDLENANIWMQLLKEYCDQGNTVLLVNHHPDLTSRYCDRVLFMDNAKIQVDAPTSHAFMEITTLGHSAFTPRVFAGGPLA
jgi:energy-coupling factor transport system ATP-binding protein